VNIPGAHRPDTPDWYEIRLQGRLAARWSAWLAGMTVTSGPGRTTVLRGPVADQAALHGLLARFRDIGLPLVSIVRLDAEPHPGPAPATPSDANDPCATSDPSTGE
jgi:hypothetical protein